MSLKEMAHAVHLGASIESVMPPGGNREYWRQVIRRYIARYITKTERRPRRRKTIASRRSSGRTRQRVNYANQVIGKATAELLDRVNGGDNE